MTERVVVGPGPVRLIDAKYLPHLESALAKIAAAGPSILVELTAEENEAMKAQRFIAPPVPDLRQVALDLANRHGHETPGGVVDRAAAYLKFLQGA